MYVLGCSYLWDNPFADRHELRMLGGFRTKRVGIEVTGIGIPLHFAHGRSPLWRSITRENPLVLSLKIHRVDSTTGDDAENVPRGPNNGEPRYDTCDSDVHFVGQYGAT